MGIIQVTSVDGSVGVTNPTGPIVDLSVRGGGYASLTGPGQSTSSGDLTQAGGFTVNGLSSSTGVQLNGHDILLATSSGTISLTDSSSGHPTGISITSSAGGEYQINQTGEPQISNLGNTGKIFIGAGGTFLGATVETVQIQPSGAAGGGAVNVAGASVNISGASIGVQTTDSSGSLRVSGPGQISINSSNGGGGAWPITMRADNGIFIGCQQAGYAVPSGAVPYPVIYGWLGVQIGYSTGPNGGIQFNHYNSSTAAIDRQVCLTHTSGNPNNTGLGGVSSVNKGDILFDVTTPALWISRVAGSDHDWHQFQQI